uniref:Putative ovule protein n=1 Tax=Solanum chacoense TaxID=4108 RepID=A0A0V0GQD8_SOLCH
MSSPLLDASIVAIMMLADLSFFEPFFAYPCYYWELNCHMIWIYFEMNIKRTDKLICLSTKTAFGFSRNIFLLSYNTKWCFSFSWCDLTTCSGTCILLL